jgi:hypothetical protein
MSNNQAASVKEKSGDLSAKYAFESRTFYRMLQAGRFPVTSHLVKRKTNCALIDSQSKLSNTQAL